MTGRDVRTEILDAAGRCFYLGGITATGVDRLAEEAGVSKRTIYKHFENKDGVVTAYLDRRETEWRERLDEILPPDAPLAEMLTAYLEAYMYRDEPNCERGCAFINASAELADDEHPGLAIIQTSLDHVIADIERILEHAGTPNARPLAEELAMVFVGALGTMGMRRDRDVKAIADRLIGRLVNTALGARA